MTGNRVPKSQLLALWREHGGRLYGPHVEHAVIEEEALYRFVEAAFAAAQPSEDEVERQCDEIIKLADETIATDPKDDVVIELACAAKRIAALSPRPRAGLTLHDLRSVIDSIVVGELAEIFNTGAPGRSYSEAIVDVLWPRIESYVTRPQAEDRSWFWKIVDRDGLGNVASDEESAIRELVKRAERTEPRPQAGMISTDRACEIVGAALAGTLGPFAPKQDIEQAISTIRKEAGERPQAEGEDWRKLANETQEALQKIGEEFGVHGGEPRTDGIRRVLTQQRDALATVQQSLKDQAAARHDPTMPLLKEDVVQSLREMSEAQYAGARSKKERIESHGLSLLCDWQDRARAIVAAADAKGGEG
jgi:hypothetical protein